MAFEENCSYPSLVCNYTLKTFDKWSMGDNSQYFIEKKIWSNLNHSRINFNDLIYYMFLLFFLFKSLEFKRPWLNNQPGPSLHWGKCLLAKKTKLNMQRPLWSKVKIKKNRMDPFEDTTGNNVCKLSQHHHQNWA